MDDIPELVLEDCFGEDIRDQLGSPLAMTASSPCCLLQTGFFRESKPIRCDLVKYNLYMQIVDKALRIDMGLLVMTPLIHCTMHACLHSQTHRSGPTWSFC